MINKSSISMNITKSDVQQIINVTVQQIINITVQQIITAPLQAQKIIISQSSKSQFQSSSVKNNNHIIISIWKIENFDYFQSNLANKNNTHTIMIKSQIHYQNIYIFINYVQDMTADRNEEIIKNNLYVCFHKTMLSWHIIKFSDIQKKSCKHYH